MSQLTTSSAPNNNYATTNTRQIWNPLGTNYGAFDELIEADERLTLTEPERIAFRTARREKKIKQTELSVELGGTYYALRDVEGGGEASAEFIEKVRAKGREWGLKEFINEQEK